MFDLDVGFYFDFVLSSGSVWLGFFELGLFCCCVCSDGYANPNLCKSGSQVLSNLHCINTVGTVHNHTNMESF